MNWGSAEEQSASERIDKRIAELGDWRGETLSRMRKLIKEADPDVGEEWKWMGTPVWSHAGIICTGECYKSTVKLTFSKGASLKRRLSPTQSCIARHSRPQLRRAAGPSIWYERERVFREAAAVRGRQHA